MAKSADDLFRVMDIHLATESFKIERFSRRHGETEYTAAKLAASGLRLSLMLN
jgi:hypothetical protein